MTFSEIVWTDKVKLEDAILLEGLPGVGNVGKLAAMHLIDELKAKKCMEIYSSHFPPQVFIIQFRFKPECSIFISFPLPI